MIRIGWRPHGDCEVCRRGSDTALCGDCRARFVVAVPRCARCGLRLAQPAPACGRCSIDPPSWASTVCAVDYGFPWQALIAAFKFDGRAELAGLLADRLADAVRESAAPRPDWIVPVPLAPRRLAERGYNQAWEIARRVARSIGATARHDLLWRPLDGTHQAMLGAADRRRLPRDTLIADPRRRSEIAGRRVAVVDDVMTTGATAAAAADALLHAGAAAVDVWVVARTPAPADRPHDGPPRAA